MEFQAALYKVTRDNEDQTRVTFECDASQLETINQIPTQKLLKVTVEEEE